VVWRIHHGLVDRPVERSWFAQGLRSGRCRALAGFAALAAELASFTCNFAVQRLALGTRGWFAVVTAGLAGNAVTGSLPGGDAAGAAVQFSMLTTAGFDTDTAAGALTAFSLLSVGGLLALPIFALPAMLAGAPVSPGLVHTAILGIAAFVLFAIFGAVLLLTNRPLEVISRAVQHLANLLRRRRPPLTSLDRRVLAERDTIRAVLGEKWWQAILLITGRLGFDYGCLLAALRATGAHPRPSLVLLAYSPPQSSRCSPSPLGTRHGAVLDVGLGHWKVTWFRPGYLIDEPDASPPSRASVTRRLRRSRRGCERRQPCPAPITRERPVIVNGRTR
jgi:Lysylphosphatidylglycerol synthase TM region